MLGSVQRTRTPLRRPRPRGGRAAPLWEWLHVADEREDVAVAHAKVRQVPVAESGEPFTVTAVWSPAGGRWVFFCLLGMPFGLSSAVLDFNRVTAFTLAVARRALAIPVLGFK